jgi:hypothetical protein
VIDGSIPSLCGSLEEGRDRAGSTGSITCTSAALATERTGAPTADPGRGGGALALLAATADGRNEGTEFKKALQRKRKYVEGYLRQRA